MPTAQKKYRITESALYKIHKLARSLAKGTMKYFMAHFDLSVPEIRVLSVISSYSPLSSSVVVDIAAMDKALVSRALDKLLKRGLVAVSADPTDQRKYIWSLTAAGQDVTDRIHAARVQRQAKLFACITAEEHAALQSILDRLFQSSEASNEAETVLLSVQRGKRAVKPRRVVASAAQQVAKSRK